MIEDYLDRLSRELDFDSALSCRVRQEVEDHLWEAVAACSTRPTVEAQQRAIADFGEARAIAAQFALVSLARQSRKAAAAAVLVIAAVFVAMKARIAWHAVTASTISDETRAISDLVVRIDRYAFFCALLVGLSGWLYIRSRRIPTAFDPAYRQQLRRFFVSIEATAAALAVSVMSDAMLTALNLSGAELSTAFLVPVLSMAIEIACIAILVLRIRDVSRRAASTAALTGM
jgi:hypothetical protein